jgi:hemoglobin
MRHAPFRITKRARDAWLSAMRSALDTVRGDLSDEQFTEMNSYFDMAAHQMRNV